MTHTKDFKNRGYLRIFASYYRPHWRLFLLDMVCALCICLVDLLFPMVSRAAMQDLLPNKLYAAFFAVMAALALAYVLKGVFYFIVTYWGHLLGVRMEADIRRDLFTHMQDLSPPGFVYPHAGSVLRLLRQKPHRPADEPGHRRPL